MTRIATQGTLRFHLADAPWPVDFFSPEDRPGFLDWIYVVESRLAGTAPDLSPHPLAFDGEVAIPQLSRRQRDIMEHVDPIFFGDPKTAAMKVLGLA